MSFGKRHRKSPRYPMDLRATVQNMGRPELQCVVRDLSEGGALIDVVASHDARGLKLTARVAAGNEAAARAELGKLPIAFEVTGA